LLPVSLAFGLFVLFFPLILPAVLPNATCLAFAARTAEKPAGSLEFFVLCLQKIDLRLGFQKHCLLLLDFLFVFLNQQSLALFAHGVLFGKVEELLDLAQAETVGFELTNALEIDYIDEWIATVQPLGTVVRPQEAEFLIIANGPDRSTEHCGKVADLQAFRIRFRHVFIISHLNKVGNMIS
jgi:hypothetical protein